MCAINPLHKKRLLLDLYTSHKMTQEEFEAHVLEWALKQEQTINTFGNIRVHVKETEQQAD